MKQRLLGQIVVVVGASGGLGSAVARVFCKSGATVVVAGRNLTALAALAHELGPAATPIRADLTDPVSLESLVDAVLAQHGRIDIAVNAAGFDVRKALPTHTVAEVTETVAVNLSGAVLLTRALVPHMIRQGAGSIVHIGGFADGRLAFPYYSVDAASRAGVASFVEAMNRELAGSGVQLTYFSPSASDTAAEQPFHGIWREMGLKIVPKERVAAALLAAVIQRKQVAIMGGWATHLFAKLNAAWPGLADRLLMNRYTQILRHHLSPEAEQPPSSRRGRAGQWAILALVILSFVLYGLIPLVPFLPFTAAFKVRVTAGLVISGEATFWVGGLLLGKEVIGRYRRWFNPCTWCKRPA